jgi:hypothetical protein
MADTALAAGSAERWRDTRSAQATILSVETALPEGRLTSADLAEQLGISEDWILSRTGIRERRRAAPDERLSDYATSAGRRALVAAGADPTELDLVLVATLSQDELTPNTAPIVAHALGAVHAGAFDVGAACTSFLSALAVATAQIECGRASRVRPRCSPTPPAPSSSAAPALDMGRSGRSCWELTALTRARSSPSIQTD